MKLSTAFHLKKILPFGLVLGIMVMGVCLPLTLFGYSPVDYTLVRGQAQAPEQAQAQDTPQENYGSVENLRQMQNSFRSVAQKVLPAVVELKVVEIVKQPVTQQGWPWGFPYPKEKGNEGEEREFKSNGLGSGVIVRRAGDTYYILTNSHVAGQADEIKVVLNDESEYTATLVGKDPRRDLALVKFTSRENIPVADLGDSDQLFVGDWVLAVGSPFGFVSSVTAGIVSAKGRSGPANNISEFIQTDAAINRGNSGGALVNIDGEVVGINTWIAAPSGGNVGLGFSIPINEAKKAIDDFIQKGKVEYGWLGATVSDASEDVAEEMKLGSAHGAFIPDVYLGSPAEKGGILPGDFVTEVNGHRITGRDELVRIVGDLRANERAEFSLIRYGVNQRVTVKIGMREDQETILSQQSKLWPGMIVTALSEEIKKELKLDSALRGVIIANVEEKSKPFIGGLRSYDVITEINKKKINGLMDYYQAINDQSQDRYEIGFSREGNEYYIGMSK